jgi:ATP-binding cassette subfamily C (CFTR/MRP) protein 1
LQRGNFSLVSLLIGLPLAKAAGNAQTPWLEAIEDRLTGTAKALSAMKGIKMTGLGEIVSSQITNLRLSEIRASRRHRVLNIFVSVNCKLDRDFNERFTRHRMKDAADRVPDFATTSLAPVWGLAVYVLLARANNSGTLTEGVAFAALSIFELLNAPIGTLISGFEEIQTVLNSFRRVQEYLTSEEREDYRIIPETETPKSLTPAIERRAATSRFPKSHFC